MVLVNWVTEMRLKVNEGMHKTPCKINVSESCTVPIWVTKVCSPFGKDTKVFMVEVIVVKRDTLVPFGLWHQYL